MNETEKTPFTFHSPESLLDLKEFEPKTINMGQEKWKKIQEKKGVKSVGLIGFKTEFGPFLHSYTQSNSEFLEKLKRDQSLVSELTIIGKHTSEFKTRDGKKALIGPLQDSGGYVIVQRNGRKKKEPRKLLKEIVERTQGENDKTEAIKETLKRFVA